MTFPAPKFFYREQDLHSIADEKKTQLSTVDENFREAMQLKNVQGENNPVKPDVSGIKFNNIMWQQFDFKSKGKRVPIYLLGAYLDVREQNGLGPNTLISGKF